MDFQAGFGFGPETGIRSPVKWGDCPLYPQLGVLTRGQKGPFRLEESEFFERINPNFTWIRSGSYNSWT